MNYKKELKDFLLYLVVGGIATVVEWSAFYILDTYMKVWYIFATIIAYVISTFANWVAGRLILFKKTTFGFMHELLSIYGASVIGLLLNMLIMWILVDHVGINGMVSKVVATILVFIWNFLIRKCLIYKDAG